MPLKARRGRVGRPRKRIGKSGARKAKRGKRMVGGSKFMDFIGKANSWLKKTGVISKVANALGSVGVPVAGQIGSVAGKLGYGVNRKLMRVRGRGKLVGGAFMQPTLQASRQAVLYTPYPTGMAMIRV